MLFPVAALVASDERDALLEWLEAVEPGEVNGAPGVTRTPGTQFRKLLLYPPELRGRED